MAQNVGIHGEDIWEGAADDSLGVKHNWIELLEQLHTDNVDLKDIASSDYVLVVTEAAVGSSATAVTAAIGGVGAKFTRTVHVKLCNSAGKTMAWYNGALPVSVAEDAAGAAALTGAITSISFVNGVAPAFTVDYTGTWAEGKVCTVTIGNTSSINGVSVTNATSVDTLVA